MNLKTGNNVVWSFVTLNELRQIFFYIKSNSPTQANKVRLRILKEAENVFSFPEKFERERFLIGMGKEFRSRTVWNYKIIYELRSDMSVILKVFHTSQSVENLRKGF